MVGQLANVDPVIADRVANGLGLKGKVVPIDTTVPARKDLPKSPALSILSKAKGTLKGRVVGCLVADGTDSNFVFTLKKAALKLGADFKVVAPKVGGAIAANGKLIEGNFQLAGGSSVLFDAVFIAVSKDGGEILAQEAAAVSWVHDAFAHLKVIGATANAKALLEAAGVIPDKGIIVASDSDGFLKTASAGRIWEREASVRTIF
jgi:catalase